jgi:hypothetical protein
MKIGSSVIENDTRSTIAASNDSSAGTMTPPAGDGFRQEEPGAEGGRGRVISMRDRVVTLDQVSQMIQCFAMYRVLVT